MTEPTAVPDQLSITHDENRISIIGHVRSPMEKEQLRACVDQMLSVLGTSRPELVIDINRAMYLDVGMLTLLMQSARRCSDRGMRLIIDGANAETRSLLKVTQIDRVLERHGARVEAA